MSIKVTASVEDLRHWFGDPAFESISGKTFKASVSYPRPNYSEAKVDSDDTPDGMMGFWIPDSMFEVVEEAPAKKTGKKTSKAGGDGIEHEGYFQHKSTKEVYRVVRQGDTEQYTGRQVDGNGWFTNMWIDDSDIHDVNDFGFSPRVSTSSGSNGCRG